MHKRDEGHMECGLLELDLLLEVGILKMLVFLRGR